MSTAEYAPVLVFPNMYRVNLFNFNLPNVISPTFWMSSNVWNQEGHSTLRLVHPVLSILATCPAEFHSMCATVSIASVIPIWLSYLYVSMVTSTFHWTIWWHVETVKSLHTKRVISEQQGGFCWGRSCMNKLFKI